MTSSEGLILPFLTFILRDVHNFGLVVATSEVRTIVVASSRHLTGLIFAGAKQLSNFRDVSCITSAIPNRLDVLQAFFVNPQFFPPASVVEYAPDAIEISWMEGLVA